MYPLFKLNPKYYQKGHDGEVKVCVRVLHSDNGIKSLENANQMGLGQ